MSEDTKASAAIQTELMQRLASASADGLKTGQLKMPASGTVRGRLYRQILRRLCSEKRVANLGSSKRSIYVLQEDFRPIERTADALLAHALASGRRLVTLTQFKKCVTPGLRPYCSDAITKLTANGSLVALRWAAYTLYCHRDVMGAAEPQVSSTQLPELVKLAYDVVVESRGYPDVLIHDIRKQLPELEVSDLVHHLQDACARGDAIPSECDWSLSTEEERQCAVTISGDPHLRIRLLKVA